MSVDELSEIEPFQIRTFSFDRGERSLDLNDYLIHNPEATFFLRFGGDSLKDIGIFKDNILVVDRSLPIKYGNLVVVVIDGSFGLRRLVKKDSLFKSVKCGLRLFEVDHSEGVEIWGTVSSIIHNPNSIYYEH